MGRPRNDAGLAPASDRLRDAFWELVSEVGVAGLSVQRITSRAGLNRSTFYRCFNSLAELAGEAEEEVIPVYIPGMVLAGLERGDLTSVMGEVVVSRGQAFDRLCLLLSSKGDPSFVRRVKDAMIGAWVDALGGDLEQLDEATRTALEFLASGAAGALAYRGERGLRVDALTVVQSWGPLLAAPVVANLREQIAVSRVGK